MVLVGSDDGVYRIDGFDGRGAYDGGDGGDGGDGRDGSDGLDGSASATKVLEADRVVRLRTLPGVEGVFAATRSGLYRSVDGREWVDLAVPEEQVYAVGVEPSAGLLLAGTRPAHVYAVDVGSLDGIEAAETAGYPVDWRELDGFRALLSREEWRLPRHENLAQVRDLHADPAADGRVVAGVEVGGVHVSDDGGETWTERRTGVDDDVHELRVTGPGRYVAATGFGLFRTADAGRSWTRLDDAFEQRYFRAVAVVADDVYASGALAHSATWNDPDADPALFVLRDGSPSTVPLPDAREDETVTGMADRAGDLVAATHRGSLLVGGTEGMRAVAEFPVSEESTGRYTPVAAFDP